MIGRAEARSQQAAEPRVVLDEYEPLRRDAALDQRLGHRAGAGPELDDEACAATDAAAIARASARPDGATAPVSLGAATRVLRKRALSASPGRRSSPAFGPAFRLRER